ncbi:MAG: glycosyltransferase family 39 protein [Actinobacteria bacterium]|nr:glycosyltransferase family 39 protein [Actinomycetota bacterium]
MGDSLRRVPAWAWLVGIVVASSLFRWWHGRGMVAPFIMVDELIYSDLARSLASGDGLEVRGEPYLVSLVYPLLLAPVYALFDSLPDAYAAVKVVNAIVMSTAAIPAYLLARRVLPAGLSLLAALLAVAVPSMAYTGTVMTENAFYPAFLLVGWALVRMLERPTPGAQILTLALALGAALIRVQGIALVLGVLTAPLLLRRALPRYAPLYGIAVGGGVLVVLAQLARGSDLSSLLGAYAVVGEGGYDLGQVLRFLLWHAAELDLYLGVFPLVAFALLLVRARALDPPLQAVLAAAGSLSVWVLLVVSTFASQFASNRIQERNMFFLAPLFLVALLAWVDRGAPRPRVAATVAAFVLGALPALIPYERFIETGVKSDTLMLLPLWELQDRIGLDRIDDVVLAVGLLAAVAFLIVPQRYALAFPVAGLVYFALAFPPIQLGRPNGLEQASIGALFQGIRAEHRDWIDRAVPDGAEVAIVWTGRPDRFTVNLNEFFSRSVGPVYVTDLGVPGSLPETRVEVDERTGRFRPPVRARYVVVDGSIAPDGRVLARDEGWGLALWETSGELISTTSVTGLYPNDTWSGREVRWRRLRCRGGELRVALSSDPTTFRREQLVTAYTGVDTVVTARFGPAEQATLAVQLAPRRGVCEVRFRIERTVVPGGGDSRVLGAHFNAFDYREP